MAKALRRTRFSAPRIRYRTRVVKAAARRGLTKAAQMAKDEKHTLTAVAAGAALGFAESKNVVLPQVDALGAAGTYGVLAYLGSRYTKNKTLSHVATGLLTIAAYKATAGMGGGTSGDEMVEGEFGTDEEDYDDAMAQQYYAVEGDDEGDDEETDDDENA